MSASAITCHEAAMGLLQGVREGRRRWSDISRVETVYGTATGFVYFIAIGQPYITHVKVGYTSKSPFVRMASLQTGCPFKMRLLGFCFGCERMEREIHDVLRDYRVEGEWFAWDDYPMRIIHHELEWEFIQ